MVKKWQSILQIIMVFGCWGFFLTLPSQAELPPEQDNDMYEEQLRPYRTFHEEYNEGRERTNDELDRKNKILKQKKKELQAEYQELQS